MWIARSWMILIACMERAKVLVKELVFYDEPRSLSVEEAAVAMYNTHDAVRDAKQPLPCLPCPLPNFFPPPRRDSVFPSIPFHFIHSSRV